MPKFAHNKQSVNLYERQEAIAPSTAGMDKQDVHPLWLQRGGVLRQLQDHIPVFSVSMFTALLQVYL